MFNQKQHCYLLLVSKICEKMVWFTSSTSSMRVRSDLSVLLFRNAFSFLSSLIAFDIYMNHTIIDIYSLTKSQKIAFQGHVFTLSISCLNVSNTSLLFTNASCIMFHLWTNDLVEEKKMNTLQENKGGREQTWNCWNFSPSDVSCTRKFFSVAKSWETWSA